MAIKINGTTVIDDSRNLVNIASGAGSSTTYGAVGTYIWGRLWRTKFAENTTHAGSDIKPAGIGYLYNANEDDFVPANFTFGGSTLSGTWRAMGRVNYATNISNRMTLLVRIS